MSNTSKTADEIKNIFLENKKKIQELEKENGKYAKKLFKGLFSDIFEKYPKLEKISWTQYTPYFNDGDPCEFSVHTDYFSMDYDGEEYEELGDFDLTYKDSQLNDETKILVKSIINIFEMFNENDYLDLFGDHVRVVIDKKGVKADSYDHD